MRRISSVVIIVQSDGDIPFVQPTSHVLVGILWSLRSLVGILWIYVHNPIVGAIN